MTDNERDTKFLGFAKLLQHDMWETEVSIVPMLRSSPTGQVAQQLAEAIQTLIAQHAYDLMQSGCIDINNAQMRQGGVTLHPHAMLRAVQDLTQSPDSPTPE